MGFERRSAFAIDCMERRAPLTVDPDDQAIEVSVETSHTLSSKLTLLTGLPGFGFIPGSLSRLAFWRLIPCQFGRFAFWRFIPRQFGRLAFQ